MTLLELYDLELRINVEIPGMVREALPGLVRHVRPAPGMSFVTYSRLEEDRLDAAIREQIEFFTSNGLRFSWKVFDHDSPPSLSERLLANGFVLDDAAASMLLDLDALPASLSGPPQHPVRRLESPEQIGEIVGIMKQVWDGNFNWMHARMGAHLQIPGYLSIHMVDAGDEPACCGWTYYPPGSQFATLWGGSTLPQYRRRGFYTALLASRVQEAARRGRRYLIVEAGPESKPIVTRNGFRQISTISDYEYPVKADQP